MPNHRELKPGDRIRLLSVPSGDLAQRERETQQGLEDAGWTADTIERILARDPIVTIDRVDEDGLPWFDYTFPSSTGDPEFHSIAILEDRSWERVE